MGLDKLDLDISPSLYCSFYLDINFCGVKVGSVINIAYDEMLLPTFEVQNQIIRGFFFLSQTYKCLMQPKVIKKKKVILKRLLQL